MRIQIWKLMIFSVLVTNGTLFAADLEPINIRLSDAEKEARALSTDAQLLTSLTMSDAHWSTHALKLRELRAHCIHLRHIVQDMVNMREAGSAWQQTAIDRITPTLNELATTSKPPLRS